MPEMNIERHVTQVLDGTEYKGKVVFKKDADKVLTYELRFSVPIPRLYDCPKPQNVDEARRLTVISVKTKSGLEVVLSDELYSFFLRFLAPFAIGFHDNPQMRDANKGFLGFLGIQTSGEVFGGMFQGSLRMSDSGDYEVPPELITCLEEATGLSLQ